MRNSINQVAFSELFEIPLLNGLFRPRASRGSGIKMVNMGEIFGNSRIRDISMERVMLTDREMKKFLLKSKDLLFARSSLVLEGAGKCSLFINSSEPVTFESHIIRARINQNIANPEFYFYFFNSIYGRRLIETIAEQVAAAGIRATDLSNLKVPFPPIKIQNEIANMLNLLDDKIFLNSKINYLLDKIVRILFYKWFIDFEFPNEKGKPYKSSGGKMVDSEMGKIPEGWKINGIDKIANFLNGLPLQKFPSNDSTFLPVIKIKEIRDGITNSTEKASKNIDKRYIIDDGDVLFSWSASLEVVIWAHGKGALNQHIFKVTSESFPKWYYFLWLKNYLPKFRHIAKSKATTMGHIQRHHLSEAVVLIPPEQILKNMTNTFGPLLDKYFQNMIENKTLTHLRDLLLPKLLSGEIRLSDK